jgi:hypothetical protein
MCELYSVRSLRNEFSHLQFLASLQIEAVVVFWDFHNHGDGRPHFKHANFVSFAECHALLVLYNMRASYQASQLRRQFNVCFARWLKALNIGFGFVVGAHSIVEWVAFFLVCALLLRNELLVYSVSV